MTDLIGRVEFANPYHDKAGRFAPKGSGRAVPTKGIDLNSLGTADHARVAVAGEVRNRIRNLQGEIAGAFGPLEAAVAHVEDLLNDPASTPAQRIHAMLGVEANAKVLVKFKKNDVGGDDNAKVLSEVGQWHQDAAKALAMESGHWQATVALADRAKAASPTIVADVDAATEGLGEAFGRGAMLKEPISMLRKVAEKVVEGDSLGAAIAGVKDSIRFTTITPFETHAQNVATYIERMEAAGYQTVKNADHWANPKVPVVGYNVVMQKDGMPPLEMQFHTEASAAAVKLSHPSYQQSRVLPKGPELKALDDEMYGYFDVPHPPGVDDAITASAAIVAFATRGAFASDAPVVEGPMVETDGDMRFRGVLAVEGVESGDGRRISPEALTWRPLPLPLMAMFRNPDGGEGHAGAAIAGRIDKIWRDEKDPRIVRGSGVYDDTEVGREAFRMLRKQMMSGVSVDLDKVIPEFTGSGEGELASRGGMAFKAARIMGATQCAFPAFAEAQLEVADEVLVATAGVGAMFFLPYNNKEALVAGSGTGPELPPADWFSKPDLAGPTPVRVSPDGRVFGHVATWGSFHIGHERKVAVPRSACNYAEFRKGETLTAEGTMVATGPIIVDTVHPDLKMRASDAQAFYAHTGCAAADVAVYEDEFGIVVAGAVRPTATMAQVRALRGGDVSPDWRRVNGSPLECVAMLTVNNSGFKVPLALAASAGEAFVPGEDAHGLFDVESNELVALVAAGRLPRHHDGDADAEIADLRVEFAAYRESTERMMAELAQTVLPIRAERARARAAAVLAQPRQVPLTQRVEFAADLYAEFANPYHDETGRFTGPGGRAVPTKGIKGTVIDGTKLKGEKAEKAMDKIVERKLADDKAVADKMHKAQKKALSKTLEKAVSQKTGAWRDLANKLPQTVVVNGDETADIFWKPDVIDGDDGAIHYTAEIAVNNGKAVAQVAVVVSPDGSGGVRVETTGWEGSAKTRKAFEAEAKTAYDEAGFTTDDGWAAAEHPESKPGTYDRSIAARDERAQPRAPGSNDQAIRDRRRDRE